MTVLNTAQNGHCLGAKSATKWARRLKMVRNLLQPLRSCFAVVLSYLDTSFEPRVGQKYIFLAPTAAKMCCSHWILRRV